MVIDGDIYILYVKFDNIGGFKFCFVVKVGGVMVGRVILIFFD